MSDTAILESPEPTRLVLQRSEVVLEHGKWTNPRTATGLDVDKLKELSVSLKTEGMLVSPHVALVKGANGSVIKLVIDGQRRVMADELVHPDGNHLIEFIDLTNGRPIEKLTETVMAELLGKSLTIGQFREGLSSCELVEAALRLRTYGQNGKQISAKLGRSESWVSKMLKARDQASPKLIFSWQQGEITDEQFKLLAAEKDRRVQSERVKEIVETRKSGDKTEARVQALEVVEKAKKSEPKAERTETKKADAKDAKEAKDEPKNGKAVAPQQDMFATESRREVEEPPKAEAKKTKPSPLVLAEMIGLSDKRPPTNDYVKGLMDGVRYALGELEPEKFGKPWAQYLARLGGSSITKPKKAAKAAKGKAKR